LIPKAEVNVSVFNKWNGVLITLTLQEGAIVEQQLAAFNFLDMALSKSFWNKRIHLTLGAKNLLDVQNITATGYASGFHGGSGNNAMASWGRTYFVGLRFNFEKQVK